MLPCSKHCCKRRRLPAESVACREFRRPSSLDRVRRGSCCVSRCVSTSGSPTDNKRHRGGNWATLYFSRSCAGKQRTRRQPAPMSTLPGGRFDRLPRLFCRPQIAMSLPSRRHDSFAWPSNRQGLSRRRRTGRSRLDHAARLPVPGAGRRRAVRLPGQSAGPRARQSDGPSWSAWDATVAIAFCRRRKSSGGWWPSPRRPHGRAAQRGRPDRVRPHRRRDRRARSSRRAVRDRAGHHRGAGRGQLCRHSADARRRRVGRGAGDGTRTG